MSRLWNYPDSCREALQTQHFCPKSRDKICSQISQKFNSNLWLLPKVGITLRKSIQSLEGLVIAFFAGCNRHRIVNQGFTMRTFNRFALLLSICVRIYECYLRVWMYTIEGMCYAEILFDELSRLLLKIADLRCLTMLIPIQFYPDFFCKTPVAAGLLRHSHDNSKVGITMTQGDYFRSFSKHRQQVMQHRGSACQVASWRDR